MIYHSVVVSQDGVVGVITLNRPEARNAISDGLLSELVTALDEFGHDARIGAVVLTGGAAVFAAGADIKELASNTLPNLLLHDYTDGRAALWQRLAAHRKPIVAAVAGYALGGGCELAMACDVIIAADSARFGQPEINIGTMPGAGGTQRLTRLIGKSKAMEMCLTGRMMSANEAEQCGLVSRVVPLADLHQEVLTVAHAIAERPHEIVLLIKATIDAAYETTLTEGLRVERQAYQATFALSAIAEGVEAFTQKRKPRFNQAP